LHNWPERDTAVETACYGLAKPACASSVVGGGRPGKPVARDFSDFSSRARNHERVFEVLEVVSQKKSHPVAAGWLQRKQLFQPHSVVRATKPLA